MHTYEDEVGKRWGDTEAYRQSQTKTSKYSKDDFEAAKVDQEAAGWTAYSPAQVATPTRG